MNLGLLQKLQVLLNFEPPFQHEAKFINAVFFHEVSHLVSLCSIEVAWAFLVLEFLSPSLTL